MLPWIICGALSAVVIALAVKIRIMQKSMDEICNCLSLHLSSDTNQLITVSSGDRYVRRLAGEISKQLSILRRQRLKYINGDRELKSAVTNISHDLRTPLTAICGYLDLLEREDKPEAVERYLEIIGNRAEVLVKLTEELFRYSIVVSGEEKTVTEPVAIGSVLEESIAAFYTALGERGIVPNIRIPKTAVVRTLDRSALARVFANLLNNAVKYSDGDLDITLSETGEITFTNTASELSEVQIGKLFDRFYTVQTAGRSTGLGLAIARTLVEQMNGTISAKYENNRLSICIELPDQHRAIGNFKM